jgi:putative FmdB family regulatory protein
MPLFEYRCLACQGEFELLVRGSVAPVCPICRAQTLEKRLSLFAVSSEGTQERSRQRLASRQRQKAEGDQAEREFYRTDHHDD